MSNSTSNHTPGAAAKKVTAPAVQARKGGQKLTMVTAYDFPGGKVADQAGADMILVGDSVANVVLGYETTNEVTLDDMIHHTAAVARSRPRALLIGDMPWMSFHVNPDETLHNAARLVREGGAEAVKLEGGAERVEMIHKIRSAEIPVMGHIGLTPQSVHSMGGYRVMGRGLDDARRLVGDARALDAAGVFALVLEGVPVTLAQVITEEVSAPTIGIGAGPHTDGQVLVMHDLLGFNFGHYPKFVRRYADLADEATGAITEWISDVRAGGFPTDAESYHMVQASAEQLLAEHRERRLKADGPELRAIP
ncbi:MAG: 3-methyl-2-oxobutanoate hydroxymethyltransferase [bacterium]|nr:3-methyl-2-oxobutanoate hydroxymethyltransferase [bacterium]MDE0290663.1 3-methyl-2-oxobutanoate hydroxymethyltransferase [bacterium]MDE0439116.1 3-methyl-2-oxobutanoate hydroxymethyltransferase [bacterium]